MCPVSPPFTKVGVITWFTNFCHPPDILDLCTFPSSADACGGSRVLGSVQFVLRQSSLYRVLLNVIPALCSRASNASLCSRLLPHVTDLLRDVDTVVRDISPPNLASLIRTWEARAVSSALSSGG